MTNNIVNDSVGLMKKEFYENRNIKQMYYPKVSNFKYQSMDFLKENSSINIPKITSNLFSENNQKQFNEIKINMPRIESSERKKI